MGILARLFRRHPFTVSLDEASSTFLYREQGRKMRVSGETMADGYAVYLSSIQGWENAPAGAIDDAERQRIAANIRSHFVDRGKTIYFSQ